MKAAYTDTAQVLALVREHGRLPATIVRADGHTVAARLDVSRYGKPMYLVNGKRRYGYELILGRGDSVTVTATSPAAKPTPAQEYVADLRKHAAYLNAHPAPMWDNYRTKYANMDAEALRVLEADTTITDHFGAWKRAGELGLPQMERHKTLTLQSAECPEYWQGHIASAIAAHREFSTSWQGRYDYSASGKMGTDGIYRAWLSAEYKGMGNGHYYLLISPTCAVFSEDD